MKYTNIRVAICQPKIILGGRLSVIIGITEILNEFGIVPDLVTSQLNFESVDIKTKYKKEIEINQRIIPHPSIGYGDLHILWFNSNLKNYANDYDLMINTGNSLGFLPKNNNLLTYMFYPRKSRIESNFETIHLPEVPLNIFSTKGIKRWLFRRLYRRVKIHENHSIIAMTKFTKKRLLKSYPRLPVDPPIIYPSINFNVYDTTMEEIKDNSIVSIGRFTRDKRQFTQIQVAQKTPGYNYHIFGFTGNGGYYSECQKYINKYNIENVQLHPNESFSVMFEHLRKAKYFLHTLIDEPFGLTAVQAIASGCIPIVHDSGGQRETVPNESLRYKSFDQIPDIITNLEALDKNSQNEIKSRLLNHALENFDEVIFHEKMKKLLVSILAST